jgi:hypothetical protein
MAKVCFGSFLLTAPFDVPREFADCLSGEPDSVGRLVFPQSDATGIAALRVLDQPTPSGLSSGRGYSGSGRYTPQAPLLSPVKFLILIDPKESPRCRVCRKEDLRFVAAMCM